MFIYLVCNETCIRRKPKGHTKFSVIQFSVYTCVFMKTLFWRDHKKYVLDKLPSFAFIDLNGSSNTHYSLSKRSEVQITNTTKNYTSIRRYEVQRALAAQRETKKWCVRQAYCARRRVNSVGAIKLIYEEYKVGNLAIVDLQSRLRRKFSSRSKTERGPPIKVKS